MPSANRFRNFCFTDFDTSEEHQKNWLSYEGLTYVIFGIETCPTTGRQHLQGYAEAEKQLSLLSLKKFAPSAHFEARKGTPAEAITYCKKEGKYFEHGETKRQGKRNDITTVRQLIKEGSGMVAVIEECASYQAVKYAQTILPYYEGKRTWKPVVHWFYGTSGSGKTRTAVEEATANGSGYHMQYATSSWWQGYDGHKHVIIDEMRSDSKISFHKLLELLDRYPCSVEYKGGSRQFLPTEIWITSPWHPQALFESRTGEDITQLLRRIDDIREFSGAYSEVARSSEVGGNTRGTSEVPLYPDFDEPQNVLQNRL